jgi:glycosyltransferase involved in cell wall biosynthesis
VRILHIDSGSEMRGGQWQVLRLMEGLRAKGHENVLLARTGAPLFEQAQKRGIDVRPLNFLSVRRLRRNAAVIHAHDAHAHTMAALAAAAPLVVSRRVAFPVQRNLLSGWKYRRAAHYIAVSKFVRQTLLDAGIAPSRLSIVYDGVPMLPVSQGSQIVVPESGDARKGTNLALAAVKLAGLNALVSRDLETDLARAGVFVYITESEGLGSAVLLAMAAGVPVIASNTGGLPEIVEHARTGWLTENSPEAIAAAIRRLHEDRALARSLGAEARRRVEERFSVGRMVSGTLAVYQALA